MLLLFVHLHFFPQKGKCQYKQQILFWQNFSCDFYINLKSMYVYFCKISFPSPIRLPFSVITLYRYTPFGWLLILITLPPFEELKFAVNTFSPNTLNTSTVERPDAEDVTVN